MTAGAQRAYNPLLVKGVDAGKMERVGFNDKAHSTGSGLRGFVAVQVAPQRVLLPDAGNA